MRLVCIMDKMIEKLKCINCSNVIYWGRLINTDTQDLSCKLSKRDEFGDFVRPLLPVDKECPYNINYNASDTIKE